MTTDDTYTDAGVSTKEPALLALQMLEKLLVEAIKSRQSVTVAQSDLRAARDLRKRLKGNPRDMEAVNWLRQIALRWSAQMRGHALKFRHLFDHLDLVGR
jgi:hypothetical protein